MRNLKVVWVCSFSNNEIRKYYEMKVPYFIQLIHKIITKKQFVDNDRAQWNNNAIKEFENIKDVDLHIVSPVYFLSKDEVRFQINGINYYFIKDENSTFINQCYFRLFDRNKSEFLVNRNKISKLIAEIQPDIVQVIGAENPFYSLSALDIPHNIISIVQLQTLQNEVVDRLGFSGGDKYKYKFRLCDVEKAIINHVDYVATDVPDYISYIKRNIKNTCEFLNMPLALTDPIFREKKSKKYDFVYFSFNIKKAFDQALEAFALAHKKNDSLTLNVIGSYDVVYKKKIDERIKSLNLSDFIIFEGKQISHEEVLNKVRNSRFALLPLAGDKVSSTIREAMSNGLPVVSIYTEGGTPLLNGKRECILLSKRFDFEGMANNMLKLVNDEIFADRIRENAYITVSERKSNKEIVQMWLKAYKFVIDRKQL